MCGTLPVLSKCCFCIPLRKGLLVWGYLKMIFAVFYLLLIFQEVGAQFSFKRLAILLAVLTFLVANMVFCITYVIGIHKKNYKLVQLYYTFNIFALALFAVAYLVLITMQLVRALSDKQTNTMGLSTWGVKISNLIYIFLDLYSMILIRSLILRLKSQIAYCFNNEQGNTNVIIDMPIASEQDKKCDTVYTDSESEDEVFKKPLFPVQELQRLKKDLEN